MRVLVGCEESQEVCKAFRALGHEAYSCDLQDCSGGHPEWHIKGDALEVAVYGGWDLGIFHPPCTYLTSRAQYWNKKLDRKERKFFAVDFFMRFTRLQYPWAIENPVGIMSSLYRKPDQIIQPYYFGDSFNKKTCLWLNGLPKLTYDLADTLFSQKTGSDPERPKYIGKDGRKYFFVDAMLNTPERQKFRSKTFPGIAKAMAEQWGGILETRQAI